MIACTLFVGRLYTSRRSAFRSGTRGERLRCAAHVTPRPALSGCAESWLLVPGTGPSGTAATRKPRSRSGTPARSRGDTPTGSTRRHPPNCRRGTPGARPLGSHSPRTIPTRSRPCRPAQKAICRAGRCQSPTCPPSFSFTVADTTIPTRRLRDIPVLWPAAADSHSASLGRRPPAHPQKASASHHDADHRLLGLVELSVFATSLGAATPSFWTHRQPSSDHLSGREYSSFSINRAYCALVTTYFRQPERFVDRRRLTSRAT